MAKCIVCGKDANFLYRNKWWCFRHFKEEREKRENIETALESNIQKLPCYGNTPTDTSSLKQSAYALEKTDYK